MRWLWPCLLLVPSLAWGKACPMQYATVYKASYHGKLMANGKPYNHNEVSAASNAYHLGSKLRISRKGRTLVLVITDTMPKSTHCVTLDLSRGAARKLLIQDFGRITIKRED